MNGKDDRGQPRNFLNMKTETWCLGRAGGIRAADRTCFSSPQKLVCPQGINQQNSKHKENIYSLPLRTNEVKTIIFTADNHHT